MISHKSSLLHFCDYTIMVYGIVIILNSTCNYTLPYPFDFLCHIIYLFIYYYPIFKATDIRTLGVAGPRYPLYPMCTVLVAPSRPENVTRRYGDGK